MEPVEEYWSVEDWLNGVGMSQYSQAFIDNGYETVQLVCNIGVEDLDEIGVTEKKHRGILLTHAELLLKETTSPPIPAQPSPKPVITVTTNPAPTKKDSVTEGYTEPWTNKSPTPVSTPVSLPQDYCEPWSSIPIPPPLSTIPNNNNPSTGEYVEPWDNKTTPLPSPSDYAEPWTGPKPSPSHVTDITDGKERKPPPLPPPNKVKGRKPPPSPKARLPDYKRDENEKGLTKLQLKLKIRTELNNDAIVLSEQPYCGMDGGINEPLLLELAEDYAGRFGVESLNVYDALNDLWRVFNTNSELVTPSKHTLQGGPNDNYDEPFDAAVRSSPPQKAASSGPHRELKSSGKSQTLPPNPIAPMYEEPFDTINSPSKESPKKSKGEQFKTMPSPTVPQKSLTDPKKENAPARGLSKLLKRRDKSRSQSVKDECPLDDAGRDKKPKSAWIPRADKSKGKKKRSSADETCDVSGRGKGGGLKSSRSSVAGFPVSNGKSAQRGGSIDSSSGPSELEESPSQKKRHSGNVFSKFITPPLQRHDAQGNDGSGTSDSDCTPPALRKLKALGNNRLAGSDLELNKDDNDSPRWMVTSRSFDNLADTLQEDTKPDKKKGGFFKRLLTLRKSVKHKKAKDSPVMSQKLAVPNRESSLTASISMPDIAGLAVMKTIPPSIAEEYTLKSSPLHERRSAHGDDIIPITTSAPIDIQPPTKYNDDLSLRHTPSNSSVKSLEKPAPPPKPSTLTRRTKTPENSSPKASLKISEMEKSVERKLPLKPARVASDGTFRKSPGSSSTLPLKPARKRSDEQPKSSEGAKKSVSTDNVSTAAGTRKQPHNIPPKPARRSIKHSGVTEQHKQQTLDKNRDSDSASKPQEAATKPKEGITKPQESKSGSPQDATKGPEAKPIQGIVKSETVKSEAPASAVQNPPPKPSRNYKTIRILPQPPGKPVKPVKPVSTEASNGNVKPSEVLKRNRSPVSESSDPIKSGDRPVKSGERAPVAKERQLPRPRPKDTPRKPSPPKPPRKSIKLKNVE